MLTCFVAPIRFYLWLNFCRFNNLHICPRSKIPVSNSVTALEIWLLTCVMLVFLSLAEYSLILWDGVKRRNDTQRKLEVGEQ